MDGSISWVVQARAPRWRTRCSVDWWFLLMISSCSRSSSRRQKKVNRCIEILLADNRSSCSTSAAGLRVLVTHLERARCCPQLLARLAHSTEFCLFLSTDLPVHLLSRGKTRSATSPSVLRPSGLHFLSCLCFLQRFIHSFWPR